MSRIGRLPIPVPAGVDVSLDGRIITVKGPKGSLTRELPPRIEIEREGDTLLATRPTENKLDKSLHGLTRTLVNNMVVGVSEGFTKQLEIEGVGFKAAVQGKNLNLSLGFSHPVLFPIPPDIKITVTDNTRIAIQGADRKTVGQVAADIRRYYPPEPYKGKGVRYAGEQIRRKEGKTVQ